jgi:hypothetical protein
LQKEKHLSPAFKDASPAVKKEKKKNAKRKTLVSLSGISN